MVHFGFFWVWPDGLFGRMATTTLTSSRTTTTPGQTWKSNVLMFSLEKPWGLGILPKPGNLIVPE